MSSVPFAKGAPSGQSSSAFGVLGPWARRTAARANIKQIGFIGTQYTSANLFERNVLDPILLPIAVVEMPPFRGEHGEALLLHFTAEEIPARALLGRTAGVSGIGSLGHF